MKIGGRNADAHARSWLARAYTCRNALTATVTWIAAVTGTDTDQTWAFALAQGKVGPEDSDKLTDELDAAVRALFEKWRKHEAHLPQRIRKIEEGVPQPRDFASFIFDTLLPQSTDRKLSSARASFKNFFT